MRLPVYSLRTGILSHLTFLIVCAMLLIYVVMVKFSERDLIQAKVHTGRLLIHALEQNVRNLFNHKERILTGADLSPQFHRDVARLLSRAKFSEAVIINQRGNLFFSTGTSVGVKDHSISLAREAMEKGTWSIDFSGKTW
ncbi:MAG: hypothetical protein V3W19_05795, partial [Desulfatiglandales bacterium]